MKNTLLMASLLASLATAPAYSQTNETQEKRHDPVTGNSAAAAPFRSGKLSRSPLLPKKPFSNPRRRL